MISHWCTVHSGSNDEMSLASKNACENTIRGGGVVIQFVIIFYNFLDHSPISLINFKMSLCICCSHNAPYTHGAYYPDAVYCTCGKCLPSKMAFSNNQSDMMCCGHLYKSFCDRNNCKWCCKGCDYKHDTDYESQKHGKETIKQATNVTKTVQRADDKN